MHFCVVKEALNKIAAFSAIPVFGKVRGNLYSVVFQRGTGSQKLLFLFVLVEERVFGSCAEIMVT